MKSKSPQKRVLEALATATSVPTTNDVGNPSWEEGDSQISVSTKLSIDAEHPLGINLTEGGEEYHSCPEDALETKPQSNTISISDVATVKPSLNSVNSVDYVN